MLTCGNGDPYERVHKFDRLGFYAVYLYRPAGFIGDSREEDTVFVSVYRTLDMIFLEAFNLERVPVKLLDRALERFFVKVIEILVCEKYLVLFLGYSRDDGKLFALGEASERLDDFVSALKIIVNEIAVEPKVYLSLIA